MNPIAASTIYMGFRTGLDQLNNHAFKLGIDKSTLACYSITASLVSSLAANLLLNQSKDWNIAAPEGNLLMQSIVAIGAALSCRTIGNLLGQLTTTQIRTKPVTKHQIEQLNASTFGISLSIALASATAISNLAILFFTWQAFHPSSG